MCGIAGRILNAPGTVGKDLVALMAAQEHRGADSTGFAIYGAPKDNGYILRGMGFDRARMDDDLETFRATLKEHGADFSADPRIVTDDNKHYCFRIEMTDPKDLARWVSDADELSGRIEVQSCGRSLEIVKDIGGAEEVGEKHTLTFSNGSPIISPNSVSKKTLIKTTKIICGRVKKMPSRNLNNSPLSTCFPKSNLVVL